MNPLNYIMEVKRLYAPLADEARAKQMSAYLKNQFTFVGISAPIRREALKPLNHLVLDENQLFAIAEALWELPKREYRYAAIDLLAKHHKNISVESIKRMLLLVRREPWWETVDGLSGVISNVIARAIKNDFTAQEVMDSAIDDNCLWVRRVAMIHQLGWRLDTDEERLFNYATKLSSEKEFFIRKSIGWAMRDYARWNPSAVWDYVLNHKDRLSRLTIREATKYIQI